MSISPNAIFQADCLDLFERIDDKSVSLVYLDPLWYETANNNSDKEFNLYLEFLSKVTQQSHRVLKDNGNLYFHLLPSFSNYVRIILDQVFGRGNFRTEFILPRKNFVKGVNRGLRLNHETVVLYGKSDKSIFNPPTKSISAEEVGYRFKDDSGTYRLVSLISPIQRPNLTYDLNGTLPPEGKSWKYSKDKMAELQQQGKIQFTEKSNLPYLKQYVEGDSIEIEIDNIWDDLMPRLTPGENQNYYAQKPLSILERVIYSGSNEGDAILDPFCGSGTALVAAQNLNRKWIGCDISQEAFEISMQRIEKHFGKETSFSVMKEEELKNIRPVSLGYNSIMTGMEYATKFVFEFNKPVKIEETKYYEFKEVNSPNPVDTIKNTADEYAVAFLNSEGGRIFWGITDNKVAVGVKLAQPQRDRIRKEVTNKLNEIVPKLSPSDYSIRFYQITENDFPKDDLFVVEVSVPMPRNSEFLYATGGGQVWLKTDSGKRKLTPIEIQQETIKRHLK